MAEYKCSNCKDKKELFDQNGFFVMRCYICADPNTIGSAKWKYEPKKVDNSTQRSYNHKRLDNGDSLIENVGYAILFGII